MQNIAKRIKTLMGSIWRHLGWAMLFWIVFAIVAANCLAFVFSLPPG